MTTNSTDNLRTCRDCGIELQPVRLLDATRLGSGGQGAVHVDFNYASPDAKPSIWTGVAVAGVVHAMACPQCGLIQLYVVEKPE
ncbi:MAG: hypothetical protein H7062_22965 [Candidatus Saccharimonas sp.]|nr:hypothetical protein [Planctomycetaceae bacterium]